MLPPHDLGKGNRRDAQCGKGPVRCDGISVCTTSVASMSLMLLANKKQKNKGVECTEVDILAESVATQHVDFLSES